MSGSERVAMSTVDGEGTPPAPPAERTCFVIMPVSTPQQLRERYRDGDKHFVNVYEHLFRPAIIAAGMHPLPPKFDGGGVIHAQIIAHLAEADLVLCDMSALNPNVFFELGVRTALNKPVAMIRDSFMTEIPFDQVPVNIPEYSGQMGYEDLDKQRAEIRDHISRCAAGGSQNEMWNIFGIQASATPRSPGGPDDESKIDLMLKLLQRDTRDGGPRGHRLTPTAEQSKVVAGIIAEHIGSASSWYRDDDGSFEVIAEYEPGADVLAQIQSEVTDVGLTLFLRTSERDLMISEGGVQELGARRRAEPTTYDGEEPF